MAALMLLVWGLLTLATGTSSLSYDFDDVSGGRVLYALHGKPLWLTYNLPSSGPVALSFEWTITLLNGTNFTDLSHARNSLSKFLTINIPEPRSSSLEFISFDASLFNGSQFFVRSVFSAGGGQFTSTFSPVVMLYGKEGVPPNFTVVEKRNYFMGEITVTAKLSAGWPLPNMNVNGTVLLPVQTGDNRYNYTFVINTEQINDAVYTFVSTNEVGNYSLTYNLLPSGLGGKETVICKSVSQHPSFLSCSYQAFPLASAVLTCSYNSVMISGQPTVDDNNGSGLFQVTQIFMAVTSNAMCLTNHTCILKVNNSISSKAYTDLLVVPTCLTPGPNLISTAFSPTTNFKRCTWALLFSDDGVASWTEDTCFLRSQAESLLLEYNTSSEKYQVELDGSTTKHQFRGLVPGRLYDLKLQAVSQDQIIELAFIRFEANGKTEDCQTNDTGFAIAVSIVSVLLAGAAAFIVYLHCSGKRNRKKAKEDTDVEMHASPVYQDRASTVRKKADLPNEPNVAVYASISESA